MKKRNHLQSDERMIQSLKTRVRPFVERFPSIGQLLLNIAPDSHEAWFDWENLAEMSEEAQVREYVFDDYVLLHPLVGDTVLLAFIRHTKEISFDFDNVWRAKR